LEITLLATSGIAAIDLDGTAYDYGYTFVCLGSA